MRSESAWRRKHRRRRALVAGALAAFALPVATTAGAWAHGTAGATGTGPTARAAQLGPEPPLEPTPQGRCGPGSREETDIQGRVTPEDHASGRAARGFTCNTELAGAYRKPNAQGTVAGYKVERYVDAAGHECAYYDTTLMFPFNLIDAEAGVNVLDMADPRNPRLTDRLLTPAMLTPHESLVLSQRRGLLAAVVGNLFTNVGQIDIYDVSKDCRHPELLSSTPMGLLGHESGMAPDGNTFYSADPGLETLVAVDISNPRAPVAISFHRIDSHGLNISDDGNRAYVAGTDSGLHILDTSEVQARRPGARMHEVSNLRWRSMSIPQNAIPVTINGHPYVVEIDEFGHEEREVGAGRLIDNADERNPRVVSNLRLEIHQPENLARAENDNGAQNPVQGYSGHYCNVPRRVDPGIVACSMILSGLRVFDIRDPLNPREIAYFNAPVTPRILPPFGINPPPSNWAMSSPSFVPQRGEIWYSDGLSGFYNVRVTNGVWPFANSCLRSSTIALRLGRQRGARNVRVTALVNGRIRLRRSGRDIRRIVLRGLPRRGRLSIRAVATTSRRGRVVTSQRWNGCQRSRARVSVRRGAIGFTG